MIEEIKEEKLSNDDIFKNITLIDLYNMYNKLIESYIGKQNKNNVIQRNIKSDLYKIEDKYDYLLKVLKDKKIQNFNVIMDECENKLECVVTFLALLELIKQRKVKVYQTTNFGDIMVKGCEEDGNS